MNVIMLPMRFRPARSSRKGYLQSSWGEARLKIKEGALDGRGVGYDSTEPQWEAFVHG
jgi:hypothetical protein